MPSSAGNATTGEKSTKRIRFHALRYLLYIWRKKLSQAPKIIRELTPQIEHDQIVRPATSDVYAIVVKYVRFGLTPNFLALLDQLSAASVNAVVVCNGAPSPADLALLRQRAHRILVRPNIGRDMGAYRAASLHLAAEATAISRMLYFNDSLIYIPGPGLDTLVRKLSRSTYDVVGATENHEFSHHMGSFAFSLSDQAFRDPKVLTFWKTYRPYDLRPHAIQKGELKLSRLLKRRGYHFDMVYRADHLATRLNALNFAKLVDLLRFMPRNFQDHALPTALGSIASLAGLFAPDNGSTAGDGMAIPRRLMGQDAPAPEDRLIKASLINHIMSTISERSQIHYGFGLFHKLFGCPIVKKDLLQRNIFAEQQVTEILHDLPADQRDAVLRELINRGRTTHLSKKDRFLDRSGLL